MAVIEVVYCDNCGEDMSLWGKDDVLWYPELPYDVESAFAGESGVVCKECDSSLRGVEDA